jgi:hypothetical protein
MFEYILVSYFNDRDVVDHQKIKKLKYASKMIALRQLIRLVKFSPSYRPSNPIRINKIKKIIIKILIIIQFPIII